MNPMLDFMAAKLIAAVLISVLVFFVARVVYFLLKSKRRVALYRKPLVLCHSLK